MISPSGSTASDDRSFKSARGSRSSFPLTGNVVNGSFASSRGSVAGNGSAGTVVVAGTVPSFEDTLAAEPKQLTGEGKPF